MNKLLFLLINLLLFSNLYAQTAQEYYDLAGKKYKQEDYNYALTLIKKSIALDSTNINSRLFSSDIYLKLDRMEEAIYELAKAVAIDSTEAEIYNSYGNLCMSLNLLDESIAYFGKAIHFAEGDSAKFHYYLNSATAKGVLRDFEGAIHDFEEGYAIDSTNFLILNNLAAIYQEVGQKQKGIAMLKKTILLYPEFIGPYVNLGLTYSEIDSLELSEYYFNEGVKIDPKDPLLLNNRGFLFYKKKEFQKALRDINNSLDIYPTNAYAYRNRALTYLALDLKKEACKDLSIAQYYECKNRYGDEVDELLKAHCEKE